MPAVHTGLNWLSPGFVTSVPWRNLMTSFAGMRKLKPCTIAPPDGESETNVITPTSEASSVTAGPPLLPCAAGASLWMTSWPIASCLKPDTAPLVTEASRRRERDGRRHAHERGVGGDGGAAAVAVRRRGVALDDVLADRVLFEARHGAVGDRGLERHAPVQQLVREDDAREAEDMDGI